MLESSGGMSAVRSKRLFMLKKPGLVMAIASSVNGIIFAKSFDRFSLT